MASYKCIRKCHYMGKLWKEGVVVAFDQVPPKHFVPVDAEAIEAYVAKPKADPMKPNNQQAVSALSQFVSQPKAEGFASSLPKQENLNVTKKAGRKKDK